MDFRSAGFFRRHKRTLVAIAFLSAFSLTVTYAIPPTNKYQPAETLDPSCVPGTTNCTVTIFPDQATHAGEFLMTDGTTISWSPVAASGLTLQTNSTPNGSQALLNLFAGANVTLTDNGSGRVTIAAPSQNLQVVTDAGSTTTNTITVANGVRIGSGLSNSTLNIGIGYQSLNSVTSGGGLLGLGYQTLTSDTSGNSNIAIGYGSLQTNTTGSHNIGVGVNTLNSSLSGNNNTAIGSYALWKNTTGANNTASGSNALTNNLDGTNNTAYGSNTLRFNTSGTWNTAYGTLSLSNNTTGGDNTAIGTESLLGIVTGTDNVGLGKNARYENDGSFNTIVGRSAGYSSTGNRNVFLGFSAGYDSTGDDKLYIDNTGTLVPLIYGDFAANSLIINGGAAAADASVVFSVNSTTKGTLLTRMTTTQRNAIASPAEGLIVFDTDLNSYFQYTGVAWQNLYNTGTGGSITLQTDGVENIDQTLLNLEAGSNITLTDNGNGTITIDAAGGGGGGSGTVTSVGLTAPTGFSVTGSPVTGSGTLALTTSLSGLIYGTGSGFAALADPAANAMLGWDDTDNSNGYWTLGNGLTYNHSTHTLDSLIGSTSTDDSETWLGTSLAGLGTASTSGTVFIGVNAGQNATGAYDAIFMGRNAGNAASAAAVGVYIGTSAGYQATNADGGTFLGWQAGYLATNASNGAFIGPNAGNGASNAVNSVFIGSNAGAYTLSPLTGTQNAANAIFIGRTAGNTPADATLNNSGSFNDVSTFANTSILIGNHTSTGGFSNSIAIGAYATNTATNQFMVGSTNRRIENLVFNGGTGNTCSIAASTGVTCSSDERLKTNITDIPSTLDALNTLRTVTYNWKSDPEGKPMVGFIAQNLQDQFPELVTENIDGMLSVNYAQMTPILTRAIQELDVKVESIESLVAGTEEAPTFADKLIAWFGDITNGITKIFAGEIETKNLCVSDDAGDKTCITKAELDALLNNGGNTYHEPAPVVETPIEETPKADAGSTPDTTSTPIPDQTPVEPVETAPATTNEQPPVIVPEETTVPEASAPATETAAPQEIPANTSTPEAVPSTNE